jgi:hypothetical protein
MARRAKHGSPAFATHRRTNPRGLPVAERHKGARHGTRSTHSRPFPHAKSRGGTRG